MISLLCALIFPGAQSAFSQVNAEQVTRIGRNVLAMDDYLLSIQYFNLAIKAKPYLSDPYYYRALAKLMLDDFKGAEEDCTLAIERNKYKYEAYRVRGFARMRLDADSAAVEDFDSGLSLAPDDKFFLYYKALALSDSEKYERADSTFRQLLRHYPRFDEGLAAYSRMLLATGDTTAALSAADNALKVSKNQIFPYLVKAEIGQARGEWEDAAAALTEAMRLEPRETSLYINRAFMRYNADDFFGAMADYNYAIDLDPDNRAAIYNRALLRLQVQDLTNALKDFSAILDWDPDNFPARYNRVMISFEFCNYRDAISDLRYIINKYPRFYQGYYALAEVYRQLGNERLFYENFHKANDIATRYVKNPKGFQLDRPSIEPGKSLAVTDSDKAPDISPEETDGDLTLQFNRLITITSDSDLAEQQAPGKQRSIRGKVQDYDLKAEPQPLYALTFTDSPSELRSVSNFFRELDRLNSAGSTATTIYLSNDPGSQSYAPQTQDLFELVARLDARESDNAMQPVDYLTRGVAQTLLKNYDAALADLDKAVEANPLFAAPLFQRAFTVMARQDAAARVSRAEREELGSPSGTDEAAAKMLEDAAAKDAFRSAMADFDAALKIDPRLAFAWYDKGCIYYAMRNYTDALQCYNEAIAINPEFGNAWYNRALTYLRLGNRSEAAANLSKAGELGVLPAYNALKRL